MGGAGMSPAPPVRNRDNFGRDKAITMG